jgi:hypothetical protein
LLTDSKDKLNITTDNIGTDELINIYEYIYDLLKNDINKILEDIKNNHDMKSIENEYTRDCI